MAAKSGGATTSGEGTGKSGTSKPAAAGRRGAMPGPGLYVVATPIGNLSDITLRALDVLAAADTIACEDRRVTAKLLAAHGISTSTISYHEHNAARVRPRIMERLKRGETVALVTDAGTPLVSDPGYKLVRAAIEEGVPVVPIPGPSAALAALVASGLPSDRFLFAGFLPPRAAARRKALLELAAVPATLVIYESARRLPAALADMAEIMGPRAAAVAREITKLHEETRRDTLDRLAAAFQASGPPKGEVVVLIAGASKAGDEIDEATLDGRLGAAMAQMSLRDAAAEIAAATGLPRRRVYARALELAERRKDPAGSGGRR